MARVSWSRPALDDLVEIVRHMAADNPAAARRLRDGLRTATRILAEHPQVGREVPELRNPAVREIVRGTHRIIYRVRRDVQVLAVIEGDRLLPDDIPAR